MAKITDAEITAYIEENLLPLHKKKLTKLTKLTLKEIYQAALRAIPASLLK